MQARLGVIEALQRTGAPISTAEAQLLLGVMPIGQVFQRGRVTLRRQAPNVWSFDPPV
jgi:hypothetical protein